MVERAQWPLYSFVRGMIADDQTARDLVQDVFCAAWHTAQRLAAPFTEGGDEEAMRRWLFHAGYWRAVSALRRRRLLRWISLDAASEPDARHPSAPQPFEDRVVEGEAVRAALARLSPEDAACLLLNVVHEFTSAQIAGILAIKPETANKRLTRAKERLRAAYFAEDTLPRSNRIMDRTDSGMIPAPSPDCARFAPYLPLLQSGELEAGEAEVVRSHVATCAWCQRRLASYATVEAAIRRHFDLSGPSGSITTMEEIMRQVESGHSESGATTITPPSAPPLRPQRRVRILSSAAATAAILLITVLAAALFGSHRGRPGVTGVLVTLPPALANKTAYVATYQGVAAVRASDGAKRWESNAPPPAPDNCLRSLALADGVLYVGCDPNVTALRASDGAELWSASVAVRAVPYAGPNLVANGGVLYVTPHLPTIAPFGSHVPDSHILNSEVYRTVYALSAGDGRELWHYQADEPILSVPAIAGGLVFFCTTANVYALRADTGALLWRSVLVGAAAPQGEAQRIADSAAMTADSDLIFVSAIIEPRPGAASNTNAASAFFDLLTLRAADGTHLIRQEGALPSSSFLQAVRPVVANGVVYTQGVNGIVAYSADPAVSSIVRIYSTGINGGALNGPALAGDMLFGSGFGYVFAFNVGSPAPVWRVAPEGEEIIRKSRGIEPYGPPTANGGAVFVVQGNALYALRASDGATAWSHVTRPATNNDLVQYSDAPLVG